MDILAWRGCGRFRLAGSERAVREPRRCGLSVLFEALGEQIFEREELEPGSSVLGGRAEGSCGDAAAGIEQSVDFERGASVRCRGFADRGAADLALRGAGCDGIGVAGRTERGGSAHTSSRLPRLQTTRHRRSWTGLPWCAGMMADVILKDEAGSDGAEVPQHLGGDDCPGCRPTCRDCRLR